MIRRLGAPFVKNVVDANFWIVSRSRKTIPMVSRAGWKFVIFHLPIPIFHFSFFWSPGLRGNKWKMNNGKWQIHFLLPRSGHSFGAESPNEPRPLCNGLTRILFPFWITCRTVEPEGPSLAGPARQTQVHLNSKGLWLLTSGSSYPAVFWWDIKGEALGWLVHG
jgi:hypothetical protein